MLRSHPGWELFFPEPAASGPLWRQYRPPPAKRQERQQDCVQRRATANRSDTSTLLLLRAGVFCTDSIVLLCFCIAVVGWNSSGSQNNQQPEPFRSFARANFDFRCRAARCTHNLTHHAQPQIARLFSLTPASTLPTGMPFRTRDSFDSFSLRSFSHPPLAASQHDVYTFFYFPLSFHTPVAGGPVSLTPAHLGA